MKHEFYYLYAINDLLNGKIYIGQTVNPSRRWNDHKWLSKNKQEQYIHRAMNKYGVDNFMFEVIATCRSSETASESEMLLIKQYDSRNPDKGYNVAPGGEHAWNLGLPSEQQPMFGKHHSQESREKISQSNMGKFMPPHTDEWKNNQSLKMNGRIISEEWRVKLSNSNKGKLRSQDSKNNMSLSQIGNSNKSGKTKLSKDKELEIFQLKKDGMLAEHIADQYNCSRATIYNIMKRYK